MKLMLLMVSLFIHQPAQTTPSLVEVRRLYQNSADSEDSLKKLSGILATIDNNSPEIVYLSYKGAATMMKAKYQINPFAKMDSFKNGKAIIEAALNKDTTAIEARYLRFTIQTNLPSFLNYSSNITNDKAFLLSNYPQIKDEELKKIIFHYLSTSKFCTEVELKKIKS